MSTYTPDKWVLIELTSDGTTIRKVLGGWYGGYLHGDSWRLNSGVKETIDHGDHYEFTGYSGSSYICYKSAQGMSGYMAQIYESLTPKNTGTKLEIIEL
jgi:hypothetical protein